MRTRGVTAIISQSLFVSACGQQLSPQWPPAPWRTEHTIPRTLGVHLEGKFRTLQQRCTISLSDREETEGKKLSAIPPVLATEPQFDPDQQVDHLPGASISRLLGTVSDQAEQVPNPAGTPDPSRSLKLTALGAAALPQPDLTSAAAHQSCQAMMRAALEGNLNPPLASIRTAFSGTVSSRSALVLVAGRFVSPAYNAFISDGPSRTTAYFELWKYYESSPPRPLYYLAAIDAVSVYTGLEDTSSVATSVNMQAAGGFAFVQGQGSVMAQFGNRSLIKLDAFDIYLLKDPAGKPRYDLRALPSSEQIAQYFASLTPKSDTPQTRVLAGEHYVETVELEGVPSYACRPDHWIITAGPDVNVQLEKVEWSSGGSGLCRYSVRFIPPSTYNGGIYNLAYSLNFKSKTDAQSIALKVDRRLTFEDDLFMESLPQQYEMAGQAKMEGGISGWEWHIAGLSFHDAKARILPQRNTIGKVIQTSCKYLKSVGGTAKLYTQVPGSNAELTVFVPQLAVGEGKVLQRAGTCEVGLEVNLPLDKASKPTPVKISVADYELIGRTDLPTAQVNPTL